MGRRKDYIPLRDGNFRSFQSILVNKAQANKVAWGIPDAALDVLTSHRAIYETLYKKVSGKMTRTSAEVLTHRRERKAYEKELRVFVNAHLRFNDLIPLDGKISLGLTLRDTKPTPKPRIQGIPFVGMKPIGGGWIKVTCWRETDKDRPSMHPYADVIECRYTLVPIQPGVRKPWPKLDDCKEVITSTKAHFIIKCGDKNEGLRFYGFFRWANLTNSANNGVWSNCLTVVIA